MRLSISLNPNALVALMSVNILMFMLPMGLSILIDGNVDNSYAVLLDVLGSLRADRALLYGETWRAVMSAFLHADLFHLLANMLALYHLGRVVMQLYGGRILFITYMVSAIVGSVFSMAFLWNSVSVGASGAIFGLLGLLLAGTLKKYRYGYELPFSTEQIAVLAGYALLIGLVWPGAVNNFAHVGGLFGGALVGAVFTHKLDIYSSKMKTRLESLLFWGGLTVLVLSFMLMMLNLINLLS